MSEPVLSQSQFIALQVAAAVSFAALPALYTWAWKWPVHFRRAIGPQVDPCAMIGKFAHIGKVIQALLFLPCVNWADAAAQPLYMWLAGIALAAAGQTLNFRVYQLLGHDGVYYGARFGRHIPWVTAWPFSSVRDPQYLGCILTLLGMGLTFLPIPLTVCWILVYFYCIWLEGSAPGADAPDAMFPSKARGSRQ